MIKWWLSLLFEQQVSLSIALASTLVLIVQIVLVLLNFYGVDRLNTESDNLEQYEIIANCDSDMSQNKPKLITVVSINIFLFISCWTFFILTYKVSFLKQLVISFVLGVFVAVTYSIFRKLIKQYAQRKKFDQKK